MLKNIKQSKKLNAILLVVVTSFCCLSATTASANQLPNGFVYLKDIDPTIIQDMRYATDHNFIGHPIDGYEAAECILTKPAAQALANVQKELRQSQLSLQVYDCYRPKAAVDNFIAWSQLPKSQEMKAEFYPRIDKKDFFKLGFVAIKSGHTRGSTVDLTIVALPRTKVDQYARGKKLVTCFAPYMKRFYDGSIDMGTGYDCLDVMSHSDNASINLVAFYNRLLLQAMMEKYGFASYQAEWWHFTLKDEPYPDSYFNFPVKENNLGVRITHFAKRISFKD